MTSGMLFFFEIFYKIGWRDAGYFFESRGKNFP